MPYVVSLCPTLYGYIIMSDVTLLHFIVLNWYYFYSTYIYIYIFIDKKSNENICWSAGLKIIKFM